jgi:hypothetical protein
MKISIKSITLSSMFCIGITLFFIGLTTLYGYSIGYPSEASLFFFKWPIYGRLLVGTGTLLWSIPVAIKTFRS